ncbi:hypothetical protein [Terrabacter carboxydivorans]|uniref:Uncharacterized protein n=1 Tax=Terrabacter carboxydivorans TaxID=619730 RepID=A0ABN3M3I5_9MICO
MTDLRSFARDTERSVDQPPFDAMLASRRLAHRRRAAVAVAAAVAAVLALTLAIAGVSQLRHREVPARPAPRLLVPDWTADEIVGRPDAFVVKQLASRTDPRTLLTVWKRCPNPGPHHDCLGREAIAVVDGAGHRLVAVAAVTDALDQPSRAGGGLLREVGPGLWYWAHQDPGPYLLSATMSRPTALTVLDRPVTGPFGLPGIECADQVGVCTLDTRARTLARLATPDVPDTRWALPTSPGCGLWGLSGIGVRTRLVIQQRDGSFATADLPDAPLSTTMAEGGPSCEVAYYQGVALDQDQLVVSLDQGRSWQIRKTPLPQVAGYYEHQPRDRFLIPPHWADLPPMSHGLRAPGVLRPL